MGSNTLFIDGFPLNDSVLADDESFNGTRWERLARLGFRHPPGHQSSMR
jgi:hypothetical protein